MFYVLDLQLIIADDFFAKTTSPITSIAKFQSSFADVGGPAPEILIIIVEAISDGYIQCPNICHHEEENLL